MTSYSFRGRSEVAVGLACGGVALVARNGTVVSHLSAVAASDGAATAMARQGALIAVSYSRTIRFLSVSKGTWMRSSCVGVRATHPLLVDERFVARAECVSRCRCWDY